MEDLVPTGDPDLGVYIALMAIGFLVGIIGHVYKKNWLVGTGIALVIVATLLLPLAVQLAD